MTINLKIRYTTTTATIIVTADEASMLNNYSTNF